MFSKPEGKAAAHRWTFFLKGLRKAVGVRSLNFVSRNGNRYTIPVQTTLDVMEVNQKLPQRQVPRYSWKLARGCKALTFVIDHLAT
jgi:hypothetical protein